MSTKRIEEPSRNNVPRGPSLPSSALLMEAEAYEWNPRILIVGKILIWFKPSIPYMRTQTPRGGERQQLVVSYQVSWPHHRKPQLSDSYAGCMGNLPQREKSIFQWCSWDPRLVTGPVMLTVKRQPLSAVSSASRVQNSACSARVHVIYYLEVTMASFITFRLCKSPLIPTSTLWLPSFTRNTSKSFPLVTVNQCPCGPPCFTQSQL